MPLNPNQVFGQVGGTLQLVRVDDYDLALGEDGEFALDDQGNPIPTGLLKVSMLHKEGGRENVPFVLPTVGNSAFVGALPEIGAIGVLSYLEQEKPIIIGFIPPGLENVIAGRRTIPALQPGEVLLQGSAPDVTDEGRSDIFVGASVKLDAYGRVIISAPDYKLTIGYLLSDEYTARVSAQLDPITGKSVYLHETLPGGSFRRVDNDGSTVWGYSRHKYERIGRNLDVQVGGTATTEVANGQVYKDRKNNRFGLDGDGNFEANLATGGFTVDTQAGHRFKSGGPVVRQTIKGLRETVGGNMDLRVAQAMTVSAGAFNMFVPGLGNPLTGVLIPGTGLYAVTAGSAMALTATLAMALTAGGTMTLIAPQVLVGPTPVPLVPAPSLITLLNLIVACFAGATGPVVFPGLTALQSALTAALAPGPASISTTIIKGT